MHEHIYISPLSLEPFFTSAFHPSRSSQSPTLDSSYFVSNSLENISLKATKKAAVFSEDCIFINANGIDMLKEGPVVFRSH